jgi:hypothetical protein
LLDTVEIQADIVHDDSLAVVYVEIEAGHVGLMLGPAKSCNMRAPARLAAVAPESPMQVKVTPEGKFLAETARPLAREASSKTWLLSCQSPCNGAGGTSRGEREDCQDSTLIKTLAR